MDSNTQLQSHDLNKRVSLSTRGVNAASLQYYYSDRVPSPFAENDLIQIEFESNPLNSSTDSRCAINIYLYIEWIKKIQSLNSRDSYIEIRYYNKPYYDRYYNQYRCYVRYYRAP